MYTVPSTDNNVLLILKEPVCLFVKSSNKLLGHRPSESFVIMLVTYIVVNQYH